MGPAAVARSPFVGRADELRALRDAWAEAVCGRAVAWVVGGEAGVGKTRLIGELADRVAAEGATTLDLRSPDAREAVGTPATGDVTPAANASTGVEWGDVALVAGILSLLLGGAALGFLSPAGRRSTAIR